MKIGLVGYGKMGKAVEMLALKLGHAVCVGIDSEIDVAIDFSKKESVRTTAQSLCARKIPWVLGTTGWEEEKQAVLEFVQKERIPLLYGPNFSIGMAFFSRLAKIAALLMKDSHAKAGIEMHHAKKKDAPSGTALELMDAIPGLSFQSLRLGSFVGTHQLIFDSSEDVIEMTHRAKSREIFARGALLGAEWLIKKGGIHRFDDFIEERFACHFQGQLQPL